MELGEFGNDLKVLVDRSKSKHVLVLRIRISGGQATYKGLEFEENKGEEKYLYRQDSSGKPGLFITGKVPRGGDVGIQMLKRSLDVLASDEASEDDRKRARQVTSDFEKKKVVGITKGKGIKQTNNETLRLICGAIRSNSSIIMKDVCQIAKRIEPEDLLLTVKIVDDSDEKYLGEVPDFVKLFKDAVTRVRSNRIDIGIRQTLGLKCTICNNEAVYNEFEQRPLPFFFIDKPSFMPGGSSDEAYKVFPLCSSCFLDLRRGQKYIKDHLDFSISSVEGRGTEVKFWLVPVLNNLEFVIDFVKDLGRAATKVEGREAVRFLYLRNLKRMCETMDTITTAASESSEASEAYLSFTALFYTLDRQGHMRLISRSEGIYPRRLKFIAEVKQKVDSLEPFGKVGIRFGFPLLRDFLAKPKSERWYKELASILGDIFTEARINKSLLYKAVVNKIWENTKKEIDLETIKKTSFKALSVIQYIEHLERSEKEEEKLLNVQGASQAVSSLDIEQIKNFLNDHSKLLKDDTLRAICATGMAAGILLDVQRRSRKGSMPFWGRLNRLEMDIDRVKKLFPQIVNKLHEYGEHDYDDILAYLGGVEISNLDLSRRDLSKELISLVFAVGLSEGYLIVHSKRK
jgi:CRISPR-associated protein Csh1